jgi:polysaccharide lyase-like protein
MRVAASRERVGQFTIPFLERLVMSIRRPQIVAPLSLLAAGSLCFVAAIACSAPPGSGSDDGDDPPRFQGAINPTANGVQPAAVNTTPGTNGTNGNPPGTGQTAEAQPNATPLTPSNTGANTASNSGANAGNAGAGGSASTTPTGTGGMGTGTGGSSMQPPTNPNVPPVVTTPPVVTPPFVGAGCDGNAFFCEDFESFTAGPAQSNAAWTPTSSNGSVSIDSQLALDTRSLHIQTQGNGQARINLANFAPPNNSFFGRMEVQVEAFPSAPDYAHFTLVELTGAGAGLVRPVGGQFIPGTGTVWGPGTDGGPSGDWTNWKPSAPTVAGRWVCMEWELKAADNNINIWLDGVAQPDLSVSTTSHALNSTPFVFPAFNSMWIGWQLYQGGPTPNQFNLWFDDIVLSSQRVGCQP